MEEIADFSSGDMDENSSIFGVEEHTLRLKVSLDNTTESFKFGSELSTLKQDSSILPVKVNKRSSSHSNSKAFKSTS